MKATLEFDLPEERSAFEEALSGSNYLSTLQAFDHYLRNLIKYTELPAPVNEALDKARQALHDYALEHDVSIW